jgi:hypothetical protein
MGLTHLAQAEEGVVVEADVVQAAEGAVGHAVKRPRRERLENQADDVDGDGVE